MSNKNAKNRDEERVFSVLMTEEEISLFSEFLEQREFSKRKDPKGDNNSDDLYLSDKVSIWADKNFKSKSDRDAMIKRYDRDILDSNKSHKRVARIMGGIYAVPGAIAGAAIHKGRPVSGGILGATAGMAVGSSLGYLSSKIDEKYDFNNAEFRKNNPDHDRYLQKIADRNKVASGQMSRSDFSKKYGKKAEEKWTKDFEDNLLNENKKEKK